MHLKSSPTLNNKKAPKAGSPATVRNSNSAAAAKLALVLLLQQSGLVADARQLLRQQLPQAPPAVNQTAAAAANASVIESCACYDREQMWQGSNFTCGQFYNLDAVKASGYDLMGALVARKKWCFDFYMHFARRICRRMPAWFQPEMSVYTCVVTPRCHTPTFGRTRWPDAVRRWQFCSEGEGDFLRTYPPMRLLEWANEEDFDFTLIAHMAYPAWEAQSMEDAEAFWDPFGPNVRPISDEVRARLKGVKETGRPMIFDSELGKMPFAIVKGETWFQVRKSHNFNHGEGHEHDAEHPGTWYELVCLHGCERD